ncbi:unnamed protein product [Phyllotreta striolata]|uniref:Small acidic protein-like domain-containing protein n=1 Tax=Phyllotreta striolata TaxID=444603 RepID=A0A9N9XNY9_PHYSR|nr:unnamed protein product [Phyllotreta striolata]
MNSLMSYGSDDDLDDSPEERTVDSHGRSLRKSSGTTPPNDTNYDEVQMSLSEDSDAESKQAAKSRRDREDQRSSPKNRDSKDSAQRDRRDDRSERDRYSGRDRNDDRNRRDREEDRTRNRDEKDERGKSRDEDKRHRDRDEDRRDARRDDRRARSRDRYNNRDDRHRQDRDRRRSRSPRDNRERRRSRSPKKSRSRSKERPNRGGFQRRFDRGNRNNDQRQGNVATEAVQSEDSQNKDRFFMPGITGRFRDQIEKRKLLWQKKEPGENPAPATSGAPATSAQNPHAPKSTKIWQNTTFAQDTDGKVANKFKRLMGIRAPGDGENSANEALRKQDEMFSAMEQQYEVARTTTHTMRGVGLGFSSFNR